MICNILAGRQCAEIQKSNVCCILDFTLLPSHLAKVALETLFHQVKLEALGNMLVIHICLE